ncbi:MAG: polymer-forming cytoskeletal protein [Thermoflexales bacterium]|nr:polymer-forming cytoskeletal protein [Thermoflexales bacterium]
MSFFKKEQPPTAQQAMPAVAGASKIETIIGPNANFKGDVQSDGSMKIDGWYEGKIELSGNLIIGESGKVIGDIKAQNVSVSGAIKGTVSAEGRLEILNTGKVWGDIAVASLLIDEGGYFRGQSIMAGEKDFPLLDAPGAKSKGPVVDAQSKVSPPPPPAGPPTNG